MRGFTLIELLIVITILVVISALALPFAFSLQTDTNVATHAEMVLSTLRRARQQAHSGQNAEIWGVYFNTSNRTVVLFKGQSYAGRDTSFDLVTDYPVAVTVSTDFNNEIIFSQFSGTPSASGTVELTSEGAASRQIFITNYGKIESGN